jgi:hypothetical protein
MLKHRSMTRKPLNHPKPDSSNKAIEAPEPLASTTLAQGAGQNMKPSVILVGADKGGVGKTTIARARRFSKVWDHAANKRKALFLSSWNCSIARVGEGETDFNILSAKPIREKMFRGASSLRFV